MTDQSLGDSENESESESELAHAGTKTASFEPPAEADWHRMISERAYFIAKTRDFQGGDELEDWLQAEDEVRRLISP